jgi:Domain of unknown function (DUF4333)
VSNSISPSRLLVAALASVVLTVLVSGCGGTTVDPVKLGDTVQASLEKSFHEKIKAVECPSGQAVDPGSTFTCEVIPSDNKREIVTLKIRDKDADISIVGLKPKD